MPRKMIVPLALPAAATSLALSAACLLGVWSLNRLQADRTRLLARDLASLQAAQETEVRLRQVRFHALAYVLDPTPARRRPLDEDYWQFEEALGKATEAADDPEELRLIAAVRAGDLAYRRELDDPARRPPAGAGAAAALAWADAHPVRPLVETCEQLVAFNRQSLAAATAANESLTDRARVALAAVGVLGPLGGLLGGVGIARAWGRRWSRQQRVLERAEQMAAVGHLAAGVAHEVRNPLTGMKMLVQAALRPDRPVELTPEDLRMVLADLGRVERTVQGLLDYAKPPSAVRSATDAAAAVRRVADGERVRAAAKGVEIRVAPGPAAATVAVDPDQFAGLLANLVINAVEASPDGGVVVVSLRRVEYGRVRIEVRDEGPGVAAGMRPRLFSPFATDKPGGTGLGLCLARRVAREHGGDLTAGAAPGGGACFAVELPAAGG